MPTKEQEIAGEISAMRDSVWVINSEIEKTPTKETVQAVQRNVVHLELQMSNEDIASAEGISDITAAITAGKAYEKAHKSLL
jgi:hypothetical protein